MHSRKHGLKTAAPFALVFGLVSLAPSSARGQWGSGTSTSNSWGTGSGSSTCQDDPTMNCTSVTAEACARVPGKYGVRCARTCGLCRPDGSITCNDSTIVNCQAYKAYCSTHAQTRDYCPKTCGTCPAAPSPPACQDNPQAGCGTTVTLAHCQLKPGKYGKLCPKTCGLCAQPAGASTCADSTLVNCEQYQEAGICSTCSQKAHEYCPKTCGLCASH